MNRPPSDDLPAILLYLRELLEQLSVEMKQVEKRLTKLERRYGASPLS